MSVTWSWLVGVLLALTVSFGAWGFRNHELAAQQTSFKLEQAQKDITTLEVDLAQEKVRSIVQFQAIQKQLEGIEVTQREIKEILRQMRRF
jgi:hypothetical protein